METYFSNQSVKCTVPLVTSTNIAILDPTMIEYRVVDAAGQELVARTVAMFTAGTGLVEIEIDADANTLVSGEVRGYRQVEVFVTSPDGSFTILEEYLIESVDSLVTLSNSFQSYGEAMMRTAEVTGIDVFLAASRRDRIAALINAYNSLSRLVYRISGSVEVNFASNVLYSQPSQQLISMDQLPEDFARAVMNAQLIEASEALDTFSINKKRQQGLMSETIGESSVMFRPEKVLNIPVTRRSLDLLRPYLVWELGLGRG